MYRLLKPFVFALSPEKAHAVTMALLDAASYWTVGRWFLTRWFGASRPVTDLARSVAGMAFPNPVGLAAGFDKDGKHLRGLACLGFGFIEVGTVTPRPQDGNPKPRLFRLPADKAVINRMGFNNEGLDALAERLRQWRKSGHAPYIIIGGNIGKNKDTPNESAQEDYLKGLVALHPWVDYFVVNVSSPNTPGLRALQEKEPLTQLLQTLQDKNQSLDNPKPLFLKIAPDLTNEQLDDIADIAKVCQLAGLIATNTTIERTGLHTPAETVAAIGAGGLSGTPLRARSTEVLRYLRAKLPHPIVLIGVGGIDSPAAAIERLEAGADLVQVYSGLIYEGPSLVRRLCKGLAHTN